MAPCQQTGLSGEAYQNEDVATAIAARLGQYFGAQGMHYSVEDLDADT